jgi:hypothetical protein
VLRRRGWAPSSVCPGSRWGVMATLRNPLRNTSASAESRSSFPQEPTLCDNADSVRCGVGWSPWHHHRCWLEGAEQPWSTLCCSTDMLAPRHASRRRLGALFVTSVLGTDPALSRPRARSVPRARVWQAIATQPGRQLDVSMLRGRCTGELARVKKFSSANFLKTSCSLQAHSRGARPRGCRRLLVGCIRL